MSDNTQDDAARLAVSDWWDDARQAMQVVVLATAEIPDGQSRERAERNIKRLDDALRTANALVDRQAQEIARLRDNLEMADDCLRMVHETLTPVLGAEMMKGTPAMFYPEAVRTAFYRVHKGVWGECKDADCVRCNGTLVANARLGAALREHWPTVKECLKAIEEIRQRRGSPKAAAFVTRAHAALAPLIEQAQEAGHV